ncbi:MAG: hypothetical protein ASARMPREDX12_005885 [Alectoria sarmentosa]|nr:MAG: hypothetical protein ASARMPREDX12_005885 [Alectoria sarmentosa]CAD6592802.1 MAG: hypothetical protein ASARMPRED_006727 [Alectoria sarmentosa]
MDNIQAPETFASSNAAGATFGPPRSLRLLSPRGGVVAFATTRTRSILADVFTPSEVPLAAYLRVARVGDTGSMGNMGSMGSMRDMRSIRLSPSLNSRTAATPSFGHGSHPGSAFGAYLGFEAIRESTRAAYSRLVSIIDSASLLMVNTSIGSTATADARRTILESPLIIARKDLSEESYNCPMCREAFEIKNGSGVHIRLHCEHIFGKFCISKWISNNTCPLCRATIFAPTAPTAMRDSTSPTTLALRDIDEAEEANEGNLEQDIHWLLEQRSQLIADRDSYSPENAIHFLRASSQRMAWRPTVRQVRQVRPKA